MPSWYELLQGDGSLPEWPYPVAYDKINRVDTDVLVLGGGIAGCHAAMSAAKRGARVVVVEKAAVTRSGAGGGGVDHWQGACTNPCSGLTPEEWTEAALRICTFDSGIMRYIKTKESWPCLLDCEEAGVQIRDIKDEFKGAPFRDEETKLLFAYDYRDKHTIRVCGHNMKPSLAKAIRRLGVQVYDRVQATSLLTEGGRQGGRVIGATGVNVRTGEFYVFRAKATVAATARPGRLWTFSTELTGGTTYFGGPGCTGDGFAMGWRAGAELVRMEGSGGAWQDTPFRYIPYGVGNADNTWAGCSMVDAKGRELPWLDRDGHPIESEVGRFLPRDDQADMLPCGSIGYADYDSQWPALPADKASWIRDGRLTLPLWADLPAMSAHERRAIFGLMVGNESRTRQGVYKLYTKGGFDPDKDMLMAPVMAPEAYDACGDSYWSGMDVPHLNSVFGCGFLVDWDLKTTLDGLYAAGESAYGGGAHSGCATTGRYAGRKAADAAKAAGDPVLDEEQVQQERQRVYAAVRTAAPGYGWKELNAGLCRIMQDLCGSTRHEETLKVGLQVLRQYRESEMERAHAANPHELCGLLECESLLTIGEIVMHASLARKASSDALMFYRLDYPEVDPPEWKRLLPIRDEDGEAVVRELPIDYDRQSPYAESFAENYRAHSGLKEGEV